MSSASTDEAAHSDAPPENHLLDRSPRSAWVAFVLLAALAVPFYLWSGRSRWFYHDEWNVLVAVDGGNVDDLLRAGNEHWITLPKAVYRALFNIFGLRSYVPYQLITIGLHVAAAALLRVVMRRAGVSAWMATIVAGVFLYLGSGDHNILRAFQMTFTGALAFGLLHLLLVDHDGPIGRRDWIGVGCGVLALACSGVGIAMVAAAALAAMLLRGWRVASFHLLPLLAVYLTWWWIYAREQYQSSGAGVRKVASFALACVTGAIEALSQFSVVAALVVVLVGIGWLLAWRAHVATDSIRQLALPVALLFGLAVFVGLTAWSRASLGVDFASQSRYVHIVIALSLPALAVGADAIARRSISLVPLMVCVLLIGVPGNVALSWSQTGPGRGERSDERVLTATPHVAIADQVPAWAVPEPAAAQLVSVGWLRQLEQEGRLPDPGAISPSVEAEVSFRLRLQLVRRGDPERCRPLTEPERLRLELGQWINFDGRILVAEADVPADRRVQLQFSGDTRSALMPVVEPLDLTIRPRKGGPPVSLCAVRSRR